MAIVSVVILSFLWCCTFLDGLLGIVMLLLSIRLAHSSLSHKLERRKKKTVKKSDDTVPETQRPSAVGRLLSSSSSSDSAPNSDEEKYDVFVMTSAEGGETQTVELGEDEVVDKVFTIGCFDLFHHGHQKLLKRMRRLGKQVSAFSMPTAATAACCWLLNAAAVELSYTVHVHAHVAALCMIGY